MGRGYVKVRKCAAIRYKTGRQCHRTAKEGSIYCIRHGQMEGKQLSDEHKQALSAGSKKYWERMRQALKDGVIEHYPNHTPKVEAEKQATVVRRKRPPKLLVGETERLSARKMKKDQLLQAKDVIQKAAAELPAVRELPFDQLEPHEQMVVNTGLSLRVVHDILQFGVDREDIKLTSLVKDTALRALNLKLKTDAQAFQVKKYNKLGEILDALKKEKVAGDDAKVVEGEVISREEETKKK